LNRAACSPFVAPLANVCAAPSTRAFFTAEESSDSPNVESPLRVILAVLLVVLLATLRPVDVARH